MMTSKPHGSSEVTDDDAFMDKGSLPPPGQAAANLAHNQPSNQIRDLNVNDTYATTKRRCLDVRVSADVHLAVWESKRQLPNMHLTLSN